MYNRTSVKQRYCTLGQAYRGQEKKQSKNISLLAEHKAPYKEAKMEFCLPFCLRSSSSQDEPEPQPAVQPMKSAGSVGHPDTCKAT